MFVKPQKSTQWINDEVTLNVNRNFDCVAGHTHTVKHTEMADRKLFTLCFYFLFFCDLATHPFELHSCTMSNKCFYPGAKSHNTQQIVNIVHTEERHSKVKTISFLESLLCAS